MVTLEPVIQVRELPPARARLRDHLPSLNEMVRSTPMAEEALLLTYLMQGAVCGIYNDRGLVFDVLQPGTRVDEISQRDPRLVGLNIQPGLILTDGVWVWPGVLAYYVALYHIQLPARFLQFAANRHWKIDSSAINPDELNWDAYDAATAIPVSANP
jgi:hypothetical protein